MDNIQRRYEIMVKQYDDLLRKYNDLLIITKKATDTSEHCINKLEKELEPFMDEYFKGLTKVDIAKLAKKSIRLTKENNNLVYLLEEINEKIELINSSPVKKMKEIQNKIKEVLNA